MSPIIAAELPTRGVLRLSGPDTRTFLQGLISNDIETLTPQRGLYAALLTAQGKFLHELILADDGAAVLIDTEAARRADLLRRLTLYRLRAKVEIADISDQFTVIALWGEGAAAAFGLDEAAGQSAAIAGGGVALVDPRLGALGLRLILPRTAAEAVQATHGLTLNGSDRDWHRHRLPLGVADGSLDMAVDKTLLLEANFEALNGVSFTKGCYVGQELTARTKYRATLRKRLTPVTFDGPPPITGTPILIGEREAGVMRSAVDGVGLALLRIEDLDAGAAPMMAGDTLLQPHRPVWLPADPLP